MSTTRTGNKTHPASLPRRVGERKASFLTAEVRVNQNLPDYSTVSKNAYGLSLKASHTSPSLLSLTGGSHAIHFVDARLSLGESLNAVNALIQGQRENNIVLADGHASAGSDEILRNYAPSAPIVRGTVRAGFVVLVFQDTKRGELVPLGKVLRATIRPT